MEPVLSRIPPTASNTARDLQLRLYREIGISAVAAALGVPVPKPIPVTTRPAAPRRAA